MDGIRIGYARCSTSGQDLRAQREQLEQLGVERDRIYTDRGLTGTNTNRPGLDQALAALRGGDMLVVPKLDRLARSVPDARDIAAVMEQHGITLQIGPQTYDPNDPMGKMFFNILATFAEFEADLIRMRTREGMAQAKAKGKLRGKQPKLPDKAQRTIRKRYADKEDDASIADLAEEYRVSRSTIHRVIHRSLPPAAAGETSTPDERSK